jgi:Activator of Hsp90 ATPase homolog 1-like protein
MSYDWSTFKHRIPIRATREELYQALATLAGLQRWFLRVAEFSKPDGSSRDPNSAVEVGDTYRWLWYGYPNSVEEKGAVLEAVNNDHVRLTFAGGCNVRISIIEENGTMIVELIQDNIPLDEDSRVNLHLECSTGWTFYLANLKSILEGGIDLRNKDEAIRGVLNA